MTDLDLLAEEVPEQDNSGSDGTQQEALKNTTLITSNPASELPLEKSIAGISDRFPQLIGGPAMGMMLTGTVAQISQSLADEKEETKKLRGVIEKQRNDLENLRIQNTVYKTNSQNKIIRNINITIGTSFVNLAVFFATTDQYLYAVGSFLIGATLCVIGWNYGSKEPEA